MKLELTTVKDKMQKVGLSKEIIEQECSFALQAINKSKQLTSATIESKQAAILNIAQTGLTLNPVLKLAYLVPRWSKEGTQCCLEPSYQGLVKLLTDTGSVTAINTQLVYAEDEFNIDAANFDNPIYHKPEPFKERGDIVGVYSIAILPDGSKMYEVMSIEQLYEIREMSESYKAHIAGKLKSCVWVNHEGEMMRKTVLRRFVKYLPKSDKYKNVATAIHLDEQDYQASESSKRFALELLESSTIVERLERAAYENSINYANSTEISQLIEDLKERQVDNGRYSASEINKKVEQISKH